MFLLVRDKKEKEGEAQKGVGRLVLEAFGLGRRIKGNMREPGKRG